MVFYKERDNERPPLSRLLPHLYLGAESDVTQDCLSAQGISHVLSVSRCSPQPTFLPCSQYLRIPIDDSLRDDLLPWIPEALRFIDGAMSSGGSVLVHCAAGISRSPALAVAYIMYSLGLDLDHAYRFVKERRPSISPNFNFLGQLQHFEGSLSQKASDGSLVIQPLKPLDAHQPWEMNNTNHSSKDLLTASHGIKYQGNCVPSDSAVAEEERSENFSNTDKEVQEYSHSGKMVKTPHLSGNLQQELRNSLQLTLSLSGKLRSLNLTPNQNQWEVQTPFDTPTPSPCEPAKPPLKPTQLRLPNSHTSLSEKRKSLTLSLSPLGATTPTYHQSTPKGDNSTAAGRHPQCTGTSKTVHKREVGVELEANGCSSKPLADNVNSTRARAKQRERSSSRTKYARPTEGRAQGKKATSRPTTVEKSDAKLAQNTYRDLSRGKESRQHSTVVDHQPVTEVKVAPSVTESEENLIEDHGLLSPLNLTMNKLLGWGERMLLGVLLSPRIKMGQAALPYRC
ncbi:tyrosine-protein phosphatase vhp-1 [Lampris incognitus]|uniref:tyrosine-protein phosphatase vhp-1 n=1 Tax=Lampris incognitus TaxID=2546036 RepID=UPI0024B60A82|nr:tyrosine-protein phosphatase vhp-1 [Lampris incognitus]